MLVPSALPFASGCGETGWRSALLASSEHPIARPLTLGFQAARATVDREAYLRALLDGLRLHAGLLTNREGVALVRWSTAWCRALLEQLLEAVPQHLRTVAWPQGEVRLDVGSTREPAVLRAVGCMRPTVIDRPGADGPGLLARG